MKTSQLDSNAHKTPTRAINMPLGTYKRSNLLSQDDTQITSVTIVLPNGQSVKFDSALQFVIGRQEGNESQVDIDLSAFGGANSGVSRTHAIMAITGSGVFVHDFNSRNGTFLNNAELYPMRKYKLKNGDKLTIATVTLTVHIR